MPKSENIGLLGAIVLLLLLFVWGYYGAKKEEISLEINAIEDQQQAINKDCSNIIVNNSAPCS